MTGGKHHTPSHETSLNLSIFNLHFIADITPEILKLCRVTKVKVLFLVLVYVFNFDLFEFSAAILEKGLLNFDLPKANVMDSHIPLDKLRVIPIHNPHKIKHDADTKTVETVEETVLIGYCPYRCSLLLVLFLLFYASVLLCHRILFVTVCVWPVETVPCQFCNSLHTSVSYWSVQFIEYQWNKGLWQD